MEEEGEGKIVKVRGGWEGKEGNEKENRWKRSKVLKEVSGEFKDKIH